MHIRSLNNTSFICVLVKVLTIIAFSQWIRSWTRLICRLKEKRSSCPSNIISVKAETHKGLKRVTLICLLCPMLSKVPYLEPEEEITDPGGAGSEVWNRVYMIAPVKKFGRVRLSTNFPWKQIWRRMGHGRTMSFCSVLSFPAHKYQEKVSMNFF